MTGIIRWEEKARGLKWEGRGKPKRQTREFRKVVDAY